MHWCLPVQSRSQEWPAQKQGWTTWKIWFETKCIILILVVFSNRLWLLITSNWWLLISYLKVIISMQCWILSVEEFKLCKNLYVSTPALLFTCRWCMSTVNCQNVWQSNHQFIISWRPGMAVVAHSAFDSSPTIGFPRKCLLKFLLKSNVEQTWTGLLDYMALLY